MKSNTDIINCNINIPEIGLTSMEVEINYTISKGSRGARGPYGEPLEPDEEPEVEMLHCKCVDDEFKHVFNDEDIWEKLTDKEQRRIEGNLLQKQAETYYED